MLNAAVGALWMLLAGGAARADTQAAASQGAPRLQLSRLSGRIQVELKNRADSDASRQLPLLPSGAVVRVLSGSAAFDCDCRATVRAYEGDEFQFMSIAPEKNRPGSLRVMAGDARTSALEISVVDYKFHLDKGGVIAVLTRLPGEVMVRSEGRGVEIAPGSLVKDGSILSRARKMPSGDSMTISVPEKMDFENPAISSSALIVSTLNADAFIVQSGRPSGQGARARSADARRIISDWPVASQKMAEVIMEKYGPPDLAVAPRLVWYDNGGWKSTAVYRHPHEHSDVLEQAISYAVPGEKVLALARLDLALKLSLDNSELSSVSESEETNVLALNLADEVVREEKTPEEARAFYLKTVVEANAGKSSPYMKNLLFR